MTATERRPGRLALRLLIVAFVWAIVVVGLFAASSSTLPSGLYAIWSIFAFAGLVGVPVLSIVATVFGIIALSSPQRHEVVLGRVALVGAIVVFLGLIIGMLAVASQI